MFDVTFILLCVTVVYFMWRLSSRGGGRGRQQCTDMTVEVLDNMVEIGLVYEDSFGPTIVCIPKTCVVATERTPRGYLSIVTYGNTHYTGPGFDNERVKKLHQQLGWEPEE